MGVGILPVPAVPLLRSWGTVCRRQAVVSIGQLSMLTGGGLRCFSVTTPSALSKQLRCAGPVCGCSPAGISQVSRLYSTNPKPKPAEKSLQEAPDTGGGAVTLSTAEKVKENVKTVSYGGVIIVGVGIGAAMLYFVLNELFSSESPNNIYTHAFKLCKMSTEVQDALGTPIKCYGEETRRGWRRHVAYQEFLAGDTKFLRMRFYIEGPFKKGVVNLEKKTNEKGKYMYTYLIVDVDGYPPRQIHVPF